MKQSFFIIFIFLCLIISCKKDDIDDPAEDPFDTISTTTDSSEFAAINEWIYEEMKTFYLWEEELPIMTRYSDKDPETFFNNLLYEEEDRWSYITDDYTSLSSELEGTPQSMGYSPAFYLYNNSEKVLIVVEYVYPGSPAESSGLKRGDIILTINGQYLNKENYYDLYLGSDYTVELGLLISETDSLKLTGESISMVTVEINADPSIYHSIIDYGGTKTGYLVYTEFVEGKNNEYLTTLDNIFDDFFAKGISNLVVDLRYNPGGGLDCAGYLASAIAPSLAVTNSEILVNMNYNDLLESYFRKYEGKDSENLVYRFPSNSHNINLSTVYFLTTSGTASASEMLISGLMPYMNSIVIGEPTYGKYTGAFVISDTNDPPKHNWAIMPVCLKYSNADGYTDFIDGLTPDYEVTDYLIDAVPFGDISDPHLAKVLELITGEVTAITSKSAKLPGSLIKIVPDQFNAKRNLFIETKNPLMLNPF